MFKMLMASQPVRTGWLSSTAFSTIAHGALITAAVSTTEGITIAPRETRATDVVSISYIGPRAPRPKPVVRSARSSPHAVVRAADNVAAPAAPDFAAMRDAIDHTVDVPNIAVDPGVNAMIANWLVQPDALSTPAPSLSETLITHTALARPANGIYTEESVEVGVEPKRGNPLPRYPGVLRDMGVEGSFVVQFVVDSTGTVPDDRISFPHSMHRLFADAVRAALRRSHYAPARVGGQAVAQLVSQQFRFEVRP